MLKYNIRYFSYIQTEFLTLQEIFPYDAHRQFFTHALYFTTSCFATFIHFTCGVLSPTAGIRVVWSRVIVESNCAKPASKHF
jgi:hypothetical protein